MMVKSSRSTIRLVRITTEVTDARFTNSFGHHHYYTSLNHSTMLTLLGFATSTLGIFQPQRSSETGLFRVQYPNVLFFRAWSQTGPIGAEAHELSDAGADGIVSRNKPHVLADHLPILLDNWGQAIRIYI